MASATAPATRRWRCSYTRPQPAGRPWGHSRPCHRCGGSAAACRRASRRASALARGRRVALPRGGAGGGEEGVSGGRRRRTLLSLCKCTLLIATVSPLCQGHAARRLTRARRHAAHHCVCTCGHHSCRRKGRPRSQFVAGAMWRGLHLCVQRLAHGAKRALANRAHAAVSPPVPALDADADRRFGLHLHCHCHWCQHALARQQTTHRFTVCSQHCKSTGAGARQRAPGAKLTATIASCSESAGSSSSPSACRAHDFMASSDVQWKIGRPDSGVYFQSWSAMRAPPRGRRFQAPALI